MSLTNVFLRSLVNGEEKAVADAFNRLPFTRHYETGGSDKKLFELQQDIASRVDNPKIKALLDQHLIDTQPYPIKLKKLHECSIIELDQIISVLQAYSSSHNLRRFIKELEEYRTLYNENMRTKYQPKGLYGCLNIAHELCVSTSPSIPFQHALLTGVITPILSLFDDLEMDGDLTIDSLLKINLVKVKMLEALSQFKKARENHLVQDLQEFENDKLADIDDLLSLPRNKLAESEQSLSVLQQAYRDQIENLTPEEKTQFETDIIAITKEISTLNLTIEEQKKSIESIYKGRKEKFFKDRANEEKVLEKYFLGVNDELDYIRRRVEAIDNKKKIIHKYPSASDKSELKRRKKEIKELKKTTGYYSLLSDESTKEAKEFITKHGGKLLHNLNQGNLAAMGHSNGLCGGYSAQFLEICTSEGWNDIPFKAKMNNFRLILANKKSFRLDASVDISRNDLWMTLESGLRWDAQDVVKEGATLFEITSEDKTHATHKMKGRNAKAFFKRYVDGIMAQTKDVDSAKLMLWFFSKEEGHAVGLNYDKDGFLFHDSNTGYIHFKDREKFAAFLVDYLYRNYSDLTDSGGVYDYNVIKRNARKYEFKLEREEAHLPEPIAEEMAILKRQETTLLARLDSVKSNLNTLQGKLSAVSTKEFEIDALRDDSSERDGAEYLTANTDDDLSDTSSSFKEPIEPLVPKHLKTVLFRQSNMSTQTQQLEQVEKSALIKAITEKYLNNYDTVLSEKSVLKHKIFHEIQMLLTDSHPDTNLLNLKKMAEKYALPKCEQMISQIEQINKAQLTRKIK
ncbi:MAG: hypothetical protein JSR17_01775 [Proteobacteria bacterium]|nr:hypothetical protein [Pseudomonadota bacterium]